LKKQLEQPQEMTLEDNGYQIKVLRYPDGRMLKVGPGGVEPFGNLKQPGPTQAGPPANAPMFGQPGNTPMTPGMDPRMFNSKIANDTRVKAAIDLEKDSVQSAAQAAKLLPSMDAMIDAYEKMDKAGAIGPFVGSDVGRFFGKYLPSDPKMNPAGTGALFPGLTAEAEAARQNYERRKSPIQGWYTSMQNKAQGPVSEWER
jgi:hypothetical protein